MFNIDSNRDQTLDSIFELDDPTLFSAADQADLIERVRAGDSEAFVTLAASHAKILRKYRANALRAGLTKEEAEELILLAVTEAFMAHDLDRHPGALAAFVRDKVRETLDQQYAERTPLTMTRTSLYYYSTLMKQHDGNFRAALVAADAEGSNPNFSGASFLAVHRAIRGTSLDAQEEVGTGLAPTPLSYPVEDAYTEAEDAVLVRAAFDSVNDEEERVLSLLYGFRGLQDDELGFNYVQGEPIPQAVVGKVMGVSQPTINRRASSGMTKMRKALAVPTTNAQ